MSVANLPIRLLCRSEPARPATRLTGAAPDVPAVAGEWVKPMTVPEHKWFALAGGESGAHVVRCVALGSSPSR